MPHGRDRACYVRDEIRRFPAARLHFLKLDRPHRHHGRDRVLVDELGLAVAAQQHAEIVEPGDIALKLDAIDQEDRDRGFALADGIEKRVLKILLFFTHGQFSHWLCPLPGGRVSIAEINSAGEEKLRFRGFRAPRRGGRGPVCGGRGGRACRRRSRLPSIATTGSAPLVADEMNASRAAWLRRR